MLFNLLDKLEKDRSATLYYPADEYGKRRFKREYKFVSFYFDKQHENQICASYGYTNLKFVYDECVEILPLVFINGWDGNLENEFKSEIENVVAHLISFELKSVVFKNGLQNKNPYSKSKEEPFYISSRYVTHWEKYRIGEYNQTEIIKLYKTIIGALTFNENTLMEYSSSIGFDMPELFAIRKNIADSDLKISETDYKKELLASYYQMCSDLIKSDIAFNKINENKVLQK